MSQEYDGGDCCDCTCDRDNPANPEPCNGRFACVDPMAECVDDDSVTVEMFDICEAVDIGERTPSGGQ